MSVVSTWDGADLPEHNHEFGDTEPEFKPRESEPVDFYTVLELDEEETE